MKRCKRKKLTEVRDELLPILQHDEEHASSGAALADRCGTKKRTVQKWVQLLRRDLGIPILSSQKGYWLAPDKAAVETFLERWSKNSGIRFVTVKKLRQDMKVDPNQMELGVMFLEYVPENNLKE